LNQIFDTAHALVGLVSNLADPESNYFPPLGLKTEVSPEIIVNTVSSLRQMGSDAVDLDVNFPGRINIGEVEKSTIHVVLPNCFDAGFIEEVVQNIFPLVRHRRFGLELLPRLLRLKVPGEFDDVRDAALLGVFQVADNVQDRRRA